VPTLRPLARLYFPRLGFWRSSEDTELYTTAPYTVNISDGSLSQWRSRMAAPTNQATALRHIPVQVNKDVPVTNTTHAGSKSSDDLRGSPVLPKSSFYLG
jgi:hypothetical protein